jgi:hypothetical protein
MAPTLTLGKDFTVFSDIDDDSLGAAVLAPG